MKSNSFKWRSAAITDVGRVRKLNEDSILDRGEVGLWVVADGMGGHSAGDLASQLIVNSLSQLEPSDDLAEFVERAEETLRAVNERLFAVANSHNQTSGSTVVLLLVRGQHAVVMWAGDSRAYRLRGADFTKMMTDHTQIEMYIAKGLLSRAEAAGHPSGNMVTRAVGVTDNLMLEMDLFEIADGDRFLLCSDGLDKHVKDAEIAAHLRAGEPDAIVQQLVELTLARGAVDNVSICLIEMTAT